MHTLDAPARYKLTVEDYHKLGDLGVFAPDSRIELIDGDLMVMAPIGGPHIGTVNRLTKLLVFALGDRAVVSCQNSVTLPPHSEPEPDFAVLKPGADTRLAHVPRADDVFWLIEVSDTTVHYDRGTKLGVYARAGIREVWIANVDRQVIEVYRDPLEGRYRTAFEVARPDTVSPGAFPDLSFEIAEIYR